MSGKQGSKKRKDVSELEMIQTADSKLFSQVKDNETPENGDFAQPKGIQTRAAIANHLSKKLKIANTGDLNHLLDFEKQVRQENAAQDNYWENKLHSERSRLQDIRHNQEQELRRVISQAKLDDFPMTEPTVVMMTHDLQEKIKKERIQKSTSGGKGNFLISCQNVWRKRWSYAIIVVAIYSVIVIPMRIAVYTTLLDPAYNFLDIFTYMLYIIDVIVNLRTTYLDSYGEEIKHPYKIFTHYVGGAGFWIDILSLLNYPLGSDPILAMIGILKVNRVLRISTLITQSNMEKGPKIMMQMLYYYMLFIIYLHLVACLWFFFIEKTYKLSIEDDRYTRWTPPYDFYDGADNYWERYEQGDQQLFLYFVCLYYSVLVIGGNEMGPKELQELVFMVIINLTGAIFQAYIFGELAVLIAQVGRKAQNQQEIIDTANTAMDNVDLPQNLRTEIRQYFQTILLTMQQQNELDAFIQNISPSLALKVRGHMFASVLKERNLIIKQTQQIIIKSSVSIPEAIEADKNSALLGAPSSPLTLDAQKRANMLLDSIVVTLGSSLNLPDEEVIKQDETLPDEELGMFFCGTGHCRVKVRDHNGREQVIGVLKEGDHFGEIALIYKCKRSATVISSNYNTFARILKPRFREVISEFPEYETCLKNNAIKNYRDKKIQFILRMIKRVEYLAKHDDEVLYDLMFSLEPKNFEKDQMVLEEEKPANALYFIEEGILEVYTKFESNEFVVEQLHKGSAINHRAFFMQDQMYVNVRCKSDAKILMLTHTKMKELISKYEEKPFGRDILIYQNKILKQERKFPCDYVMRLPHQIQHITDDQAFRENCLKNVVLRLIIEIRERKKRPKLSDFIAVYREKKNEQGASKMNVKAEFQNKFRILYGGEQAQDKEEDKKFDDMMLSFTRLQGQLSAQEQQLGSVIKQVNALVDHRDKKENQLAKMNQNKDFKAIQKAKQKQMQKSQTQSFVSNQPNNRNNNNIPIEEDKVGEEEDNQSQREWAKEQELKAINDGYTREEPDSNSIQGMIKPGQKNKPGQPTSERVFAPFKSPFTEEIINTSQDPNGSQQTLKERASDMQSDIQERSPSKNF